MPDSAIRMREVAIAAGVSPATVSRALKNDPRITAEVKALVKEVADRLGYAPNPLVQALMVQRRGRGKPHWETLALVTNDPHEAWQNKDVCRWYYGGICERAEQLGYHVEVFSLEAVKHNPARLCKVLEAQGIRGVILGFSRDEEQPMSMQVAGFCVVGLSTYFSGITADRVHLNGFYNVKLAFTQLRAAGYQRPALIAPVRNNVVVGGQWSAAALDEQWQRPLEQQCPPFMVEGPKVDMNSFREWFERHRPDAILAYKVPIVELLERLRVRVPDDIGVASLYGTEKERTTMAGIDGNLHYVGAAAVDLLVQKLQINEQGLPEHPRDVLIGGTWRNGPTIKQLEVKKSPKKPRVVLEK